jgi:hypothetical protein
MFHHRLRHADFEARGDADRSAALRFADGSVATRRRGRVQQALGCGQRPRPERALITEGLQLCRGTGGAVGLANLHISGAKLS